MRIRQLTLNNHQVIREATFAELNDFVVIAGPNGVGKTKIKDAICYIVQNGGKWPIVSQASGGSGFRRPRPCGK